MNGAIRREGPSCGPCPLVVCCDDRSAALTKLDEIDASLYEPSGYFYKVSKRLFETLKAQSLN